MASTEVTIDTTLSLRDILQEIDKTSSEVTRIDQELDDLFSERQLLEQRVSNLKSFSSEVENVEKRTDNMSQTIHGAALSARDISQQVRILDRGQTRVQNVLKKVQLMLDLKETIKNCESAIDDQKYEFACKETHRLLHNAQELDLKEVDEVSFAILVDLEQRLQQLVKEKCDNGLHQNDLGTVIEFCQMYPYLDMAGEGLTIFCETITRETMLHLEKQQLTVECTRDHEKSGGKVPYVSMLEGFIDTIFTVINDNDAILKDKFGEGSDMRLAVELHSETDLQISKLIKHYIENQSLPDLVTFSQNFERAQMQKGGLVSLFKDTDASLYFEGLLARLPISAQKLDTTLQEIAHICRELESYDATMRSVVSDAKLALKSSDSKPAALETFAVIFPKETRINTIRHELISHYIVLEQFNMHLQLKQIIEEDKLPKEDELISTSSELVFYVLKKMAVRCYSTYDVNAACAVVNYISTSLESFYKEWLDWKLRQQPGQGDKSFAEQLWHKSTKTLLSSDPNVQQQQQRMTLILLNNIDQSITNTHTLKYQLEEEMEAMFKEISEKEKFKVRHCLDMLLEVGKSFERIVDRGVTRLSQKYHPFLQPSLDKFRAFNYQINEKQFQHGDFPTAGMSAHITAAMSAAGGSVGMDGGMPFVENLIHVFRPHLFALNRQLTAHNYDRILVRILEDFINRMEQIILSQKFTFWGGMQFDKERQKLESFFSELSNTRSVRDQFARIRQIASMLQLTKVDEATAYLTDPDLMADQMGSSVVADATPTNSLTLQEIRKFLSLRVEFSAQRIQQLRL